MTKAVLDSSAVLALLHGEPGADVLLALAPEALLCSVNACEVQSHLLRKGADPMRAWEIVIASVHTIVAFDAELAKAAASLILNTYPHGLSLGESACLALAKRENAPVYTADRAWAQLAIGLDVRLVR